MNWSLARQLLEAHRVTPARGAIEDGAFPGCHLRAELVGVDWDDAALVAAAFESLDRSKMAPELVLVCGDRGHSSPAFESDPVHRELVGRLRRRGAHVSRPGHGGSHAVWREGYAAPGRLLAASGPGSPSCGAFGMLVLSLSALETTAVLAGMAIHRDAFETQGIRLRGGLPTWVSGHDLALEVARLSTSTPQERIIEFGGHGVGSLTMADRIAAASWCSGLGAAVVFPSDEVTRRHMKAWGRESDWKTYEATEPAEYDRTWEIDLNHIEPGIVALESGALSRRVRHLKGMRVNRVVIGTLATFPDLARLARILAQAPVHPDLELVVFPGSWSIRETARRTPVMAALSESGVDVAGSRRSARPARRSGLAEVGICFGATRHDISDSGTTWYAASLETCAATARSGALMDPRELDVEFRRDEEPEAYAVDPEAWLAPFAGPEAGAPGPERSPFPGPRPLEGPVRGMVVIKLDDHTGVERILPWGARLERMMADIDGLARHAFVPVDERLASRVRRHGGGLLVAGLDFGCEGGDEVAALVIRSLGIRAVFARSIDSAFQRHLVYAAVLPLRLRLDADYRAMRAGDELEIPGIPEVLEPGKPFAVRNLTQGTQYTVHHELDHRAIAILRAGGILHVNAPMGWPLGA